ncbi:MAG: PepSY-associated TM helix domain-containing protein, partial [Myxococcota bacterium]
MKHFKLRPRTFAIQWDLHAWAGVAASLFAFVMFFFGVFALLFESMIVWQDPALHAPPGDAEPSFDALMTTVREATTVPDGGGVGFWRHDGTRWVTAFVSEPGDGKDQERLWVDPATGTVVPERTRIAEELYVMHFFYRLPGGLYLAGVMAMLLCVSLVAGLVIHLKDLRRQWWRFRPELRLRFSASDAHKVLGVFGLPFALVLAWSGALICLGGPIGQGMAEAAYGGDLARVGRLAGRAPPPGPPSGTPAPVLPLDTLRDRAMATNGATEGPEYVALRNVGHDNARVRMHFHGEAFEGSRDVYLDANDGRVVTTDAATATPFHRLETVLWDLHFASYGGVLLQLLYALLALCGCAVIVTGTLVWLERRDPHRRHAGHRILGRVTLGVCGGAVVAAAAYLAANRALPWDLPHRADRELQGFLAVWALTAFAGAASRATVRRTGAAMAGVAATLFATVVLADVVTLRANLLTAATQGLADVVLVEAVVAALALSLFVSGLVSVS